MLKTVFLLKFSLGEKSCESFACFIIFEMSGPMVYTVWFTGHTTCFDYLWLGFLSKGTAGLRGPQNLNALLE